MLSFITKTSIVLFPFYLVGLADQGSPKVDNVIIFLLCIIGLYYAFKRTYHKQVSIALAIAIGLCVSCGKEQAKEESSSSNSSSVPVSIKKCDYTKENVCDYCESDLAHFKTTSDSPNTTMLEGGYYYSCTETVNSAHTLGIAFFSSGIYRMIIPHLGWYENFNGKGEDNTVLVKNSCTYTFNLSGLGSSDERMFSEIKIDSNKKLKSIIVKNIYGGLNSDNGTYTFDNCIEKTSGWY